MGATGSLAAVCVWGAIRGAMGSVVLSPGERTTLPVRRKKAKLTGKLRR